MDKNYALSMTLIAGAFWLIATSLFLLFTGFGNLGLVLSIVLFTASIFFGGRAISGQYRMGAQSAYTAQALFGASGILVMTVSSAIR